ncbi:maestro heat-like repeat-containing protein family member 1 isoform X2 [Erinaceus europaeus]|uniref:Maestro heat-like repeat-containing protein family member 1 isoform X2 n=1 Tax=Erinaceus europaeus TaxID=9365 RepID=A0ABM3XBT8_ERIEU|nr:maestro heat-like repeat-containing protein family member 1 isoform X2 [Erinaceus europaeus]
MATSLKQKDLEWEISEKTKKFMMELQVTGQVSADNIFQTLKLLEIRILNNKLALPFCQKVLDIVVDYLRTTRPQEELEELCTTVLIAAGKHSPSMVIEKLWDRWFLRTLPPKSLLVAVGQLIMCQGTAHYIGTTWEHILRLVRMAQDEEDMLAICHALSGLAISTRKHLDLGAKDDEVMDITQEALSIKAYHTLRLLFNRWSLQSSSKVTEPALVVIGHLFFIMPPSKLKNHVNRLTRWLMTLISTKVAPYYISQCICQLVDALALSGYGGINLESQLENFMCMLFRQMNEKVISSDHLSVQNHNLAQRALYTLTKLYNDQVVLLIRKTMESKDPNMVISALQLFMDVFQDVPQTEKLRSEVMQSTLALIQEDLKPVRKALLLFIEVLGYHGYLAMPQESDIISYLIKLSQTHHSNEEDIQLLCSKLLHMVSLPKLITLACEASNMSALVPLSRTIEEITLKAQIQGQAPYLSGFHLSPTQFISPQKLLIHLVVVSLKPYREKDFGVSSLKLLWALHPLTSLHPVINSSVGQLWLREVPLLLQILDEHNERNLDLKAWEDRLLKFSSQSLMAISDNDWLEQLLSVVLEKISHFNEETHHPSDEKAFLYRFFGFTLRTSRNMKLVETMLSAILHTAHEEQPEMEGIAAALSIVSMRHLHTVLDQLRVYSTLLTDKDSSSILRMPKEQQQREWGLVCHTVYLSYGKIILESQGAIYKHLDAILTLVLHHYYSCIVEKDKSLKLEYLSALTKLTNILSNQPMAFQFEFPHKLDIVVFMVGLIREEPLNAISSPIRQKAMHILTDFRKLRPLLEMEEKTELLRTCIKSVLSLPPTDSMLKEGASAKENQANVDLFRETLQTLRRLIEALVAEMPSRIQHYLELLDPWLNSQKDNERERAMWCTARILGFTAKMNTFGTEIEFTRLGRLVRLLAIRCQDPVDNICFLSSQAVYNLYCILLLQKQLGRKKQGQWEEEGQGQVYSAHVFYNNTFKIAKAFAEYFTQYQLTNLVLTAIEGLTDTRAKVSLAAAQLMSAVMKERGRDMLKIEEVVEGILERLNAQLEPSTKEEVLRALCALAGNNAHVVVPMLLNKPLPWNRTSLTAWRMFGTHTKTTLNILQLLIGILEKLPPKEDTREMAFQPVAVTCALCEMLSGCPCQGAVQELYPRLLLAALCHLYWVIEQSAPQKMVVYSKEGEQGSKNKPFDPTSCALEVVKLVILAANYEGVVTYANQHHCWELLSSPQCYYMGIMNLASGIVKNCKPSILHRILNLVRNLLNSPDERQKTLARTFYAQLLWHRSVAETLGQDFLGNLVKWIKEPNFIMKELGLRGISNLALHPGQPEVLKSQVPLLRDCLKAEARVTLQAVKGLRNIICHSKGEDTKGVFSSVARHLRPLINDERDQVRITTTCALGHMLRQVDRFKPGTVIRKEIYTFLVPLLLSIQDNNKEVVKACGGALTEWTNVIGWSSLTETFRHTTLSDHIQVLEETCKYLVGTGKMQLVGEMLTQSFGFLKNPQSFLRAAAINFIALESVERDPVDGIQSLVSVVLKQMDESVSPVAAPARSSILNYGFKLSAPKRRKRLFKGGQLEREAGAVATAQKLWGRLRMLQTMCCRTRARVDGAPMLLPPLQDAAPEMRLGAPQPV